MTTVFNAEEWVFVVHGHSHGSIVARLLTHDPGPASDESSTPDRPPGDPSSLVDATHPEDIYQPRKRTAIHTEDLFPARGRQKGLVKADFEATTSTRQCVESLMIHLGPRPAKDAGDFTPSIVDEKENSAASNMTFGTSAHVGEIVPARSDCARAEARSHSSIEIWKAPVERKLNKMHSPYRSRTPTAFVDKPSNMIQNVVKTKIPGKEHASAWLPLALAMMFCARQTFTLLPMQASGAQRFLEAALFMELLLGDMIGWMATSLRSWSLLGEFSSCLLEDPG